MKSSGNAQHSEYYEAILQVRPYNKEVVDFISELVDSRNDVKVSKFKELKTGIDIYLTNQRFARGALASQLRRKFRNGKLTMSRSLFGQHKMSSRLVYRATILFRLESQESKEE